MYVLQNVYVYVMCEMLRRQNWLGRACSAKNYIWLCQIAVTLQYDVTNKYFKSSLLAFSK